MRNQSASLLLSLLARFTSDGPTSYVRRLQQELLARDDSVGHPRLDPGRQVQGLDLRRASSFSLSLRPEQRAHSPTCTQDVILSHFILRRSSIESTLATWAALDPRLKAWTPSLNSTAGTHQLEPYKPPVYPYAPVVPPQPQAAAAAANGKGKGKGKGKAAAAAAKPVVPAGPAPKDLVREVREALDGLSAWKEDVGGWLEGLVA